MLAREYETLRAVEDVHWWYAVLRRMVVEILKRELPGECRLLDAGCGTGGMLAYLQKVAPRFSLKGIDVSEVAVRHCRERGLSGVTLGRLEALPFPDGSFDAVLSLDVLYHAQVDEGKALSEMSRVLRTGGVLVINVAAFHCLRGHHDLAVCGARRYRCSQLKSLLEFHNLDVELIHYWNAWLFLPLWMWRSWTRWVSRGEGGAASELQLTAAWLNPMLKSVVRLDARLCRNLKVPFGSSVLALARKRPCQAA